MVTRDQVTKLVQDRRELYLITEALIKEDLEVAIDFEAMIENPATYLSNFFGAKGMQLVGRLGDDAFKLGEDFKGKVTDESTNGD